MYKHRNKNIYQKVIILFFIFLLYGCSSEPKVDEKSGILLDTSSPESTIVTYNDLIKAGSFEAAQSLLTKEAQRLNSAKDIENGLKKTKMLDAALVKVFPAKIKDNKAVVGYIRTKVFKKEPEAILGLISLREEDGQWKIAKSLRDEFQPEDRTVVLENMVALENELIKDPFSEFSNNQRTSLISQVKAMKSENEYYLKLLKDK